jgi:hypothetical protein
MKKIFSILFLSLFCAAPVGASEIFGSISTDPNYSQPAQNNSSEQSSEQPEQPAIVPKVLTNEDDGSTDAPYIVRDMSMAGAKNKSAAEILGIKIYPDGALLRGSDQKIYLIRGLFKRHVVNLQELAKYRGQKIYSVSEEQLAYYETRAHLDGELIRQKGDVKVFELTKSGKHHILNLQELRAHYSGLEIFNISQEEMEIYGG